MRAAKSNAALIERSRLQSDRLNPTKLMRINMCVLIAYDFIPIENA